MRSFPFGASWRRVPALFLLFFLIFLSAPLFADDDAGIQPDNTEQPADDQPAADQSPVAAEEEEADIVITATRTPDDRLRVPPFVIRISRAMIEASGKAGISETVAENAGVTLSSYGYKGGLESLWLRGATGTRVLVLLDGVPTNNILDGQMSLSLIPMEVVDHIEVIQGGMSLLYGSQAVGGVINIITRQGNATASFFKTMLNATSYLPQAYNDGGPTVAPQAAALFDGGRTAVSFGHNFGPFGLFVSGEFNWLGNEYYFDNAGTTQKRDNAVLIGGGGAASVGFPWETGAIRLTGIFSRQYAGVPGSITSLSPLAHQTDERLQILCTYHENSFLSDILTLDAKFSFTKQYRLYDDPEDDPAHDPFTYPNPIYSGNDFINFFGELSQEAAVADWLTISYGGNFAYDMITGDSLGDRGRLSGSIFLAAPLAFGNSLRIYPAGRWDISSDYGSELSYGLGASMLLSEAASLKLSLAKSFRAPNFAELFWTPYNNTNLQPERGWHADLGLSLNDKCFKLESAVFMRLMEDEIQNDEFWVPQNIARSFYPGAEVQTTIEFVEHFFMDASYTFIYSFNLADGRTLASDVRVPLVPMHEGHLYLSYRTDQTLIRIGGDLRGERFTYGYTGTMPPFFILNANFRQTLSDFLTLTAALDNILNTPYMIVNNYPMPGISLRWGLELKL